MQLYISPIWRCIQSEEVFNSKNHYTGGVQTEEGYFVLVTTGENLKHRNSDPHEQQLMHFSCWESTMILFSINWFLWFNLGHEFYREISMEGKFWVEVTFPIKLNICSIQSNSSVDWKLWKLFLSFLLFPLHWSTRWNDDKGSEQKLPQLYFLPAM